jgi:hypothetical protein
MFIKVAVRFIAANCGAAMVCLVSALVGKHSITKSAALSKSDSAVQYVAPYLNVFKQLATQCMSRRNEMEGYALCFYLNRYPVPIVVQHSHTEAQGRSLRHRLSDASHAHDAERRPMHLPTKPQAVKVGRGGRPRNCGTVHVLLVSVNTKMVGKLTGVSFDYVASRCQ